MKIIVDSCTFFPRILVRKFSRKANIYSKTSLRRDGCSPQVLDNTTVVGVLLKALTETTGTDGSAQVSYEAWENIQSHVLVII